MSILGHSLRRTTLPQRLRCLTYNVRRYVGLDRRRSPERIAAVIRTANPDLVVLQEAVEETGPDDPLARLAESLEMHVLFAPSRSDPRGHFGNAMLSRMPLTAMRHAALPCLGRAEARYALWARLSWRGLDVDVIGTHLGLSRDERLLQTTKLSGDEWLAHPELGRFAVLLGDFNAPPADPSFERLDRELADAQRQVQRRRRLRTWPAPLPLISLDHVFTSAQVCHVDVVSTPRARVASDHLPFFADLDLGIPLESEP